MKETKMKGSPRALLKAVENAIGMLPSEEQIKESIKAIDGLSKFLSQLREHLSNQPTRQIRQDVINAATLLSNFLSSYTAKALFIAKPLPAKRSSSNDVDAEKIFQELNTLSLNEIQHKLLDKERYSVKELRSLAEYMRLGVDKKAPRDTIADSIFKIGFANPRGYEDLRGSHKSASGVKEQIGKYKSK